ncbi:hypothetical protein GCM10010201_18450 [Pilimelia columellifera subsp. columellifera]|uniref:PDZ domain-containing protein n=1 Tax=Pilimelia columellifera subsp. columellifera TaxID=706583 RepID=A0ABN3NFZ1_9ACTN
MTQVGDGSRPAVERSGVPELWWSDAPNDPWRDPWSPAAVLAPALASAPALEPAPDPDRPRRPLAAGAMVALVAAVAALAGGVGGVIGFAAAREGAGPQLGEVTPVAAERPPGSSAALVRAVLPSVVTIQVDEAGATSVGSGFVVSGDGHVITNEHVLTDAGREVAVMFADGRRSSAAIVGRDPESDLAVLKVRQPVGLRPVRFGDSDRLAVGDPVFAFGSPLALRNTVTSGIVSALDRPLQTGGSGEQVRYYAAIQTDAAVNQGNSGGPLVDGAGRVVGVNSVIQSLGGRREEAGNIGLAFAIPVNQAQRVTKEIIATGRAHRTVFGASVGADESGGVRLSAVPSGGPAAVAGLRAGDVVSALDGQVLAEAVDLIALVRRRAPGSVVSVAYQRGGDRRMASVTLTADAK